ncbi:MAG TPA: AMP-binding protein [Kofleriaceae bacterium]
MSTAVYPDWVPNVLPLPEGSLADILEATAAAAPDAPAIHYFDATITYAQLDDYANRFATLLAAWGIERGDRVALYLQNVPQTLIALYGIWKRGAAAVPLNPMFKQKELEYHLNDSGSRVLVCLE